MLLTPLAQQAGDGLALNTFTLAIITTIVMALVGAITFLFRMVTSDTRQQIIDLKTEKRELEEENRALQDTLIGVLRTGHRAADAADDAARELLKRRARKPT